MSAQEYASTTAWYLYTALLVALMAVTYMMFLRSYRRGYAARQPRAEPPRYYYVSVRSREGEELVEHARELLRRGEHARAVEEAREAVSRVLAEACRRLGVPCEGKPPLAASEELLSRGHYLWPQGVRELELISRKGSKGRKDAERAIEIALRVMEAAKEIRIEPPRKAVAGQEGDKVPGGGRVI